MKQFRTANPSAKNLATQKPVHRKPYVSPRIAVLSPDQGRATLTDKALLGNTDAQRLLGLILQRDKNKRNAMQ